ncbi:MAG: hypothetical protein AAF799_14205 [Myxococcota bacterium]
MRRGWPFAAVGALALSLMACPGDDATQVTTAGDSTGSLSTTSSETIPDATCVDGCSSGSVDPSATSAASTGPGGSSTTMPPGTTSETGQGSTESTGESGTTEGGSTDSGSTDGESTDGGSTDSGTTEGGSTDGGSTDSGGMTTGVVFVMPPDAGGGVECDPWLQDCPPGEKCNAAASAGGGAWDTNICVPIDPSPVAVGDVCNVVGTAASGIDNCEAGSMCWEVDVATLEGVCVELCTGSPAAPVCTDPATTCNIVNGGVLILCLPTCDPLMQDCSPGSGCYPVADQFTCAPDASGGGGVDGDTCEFINACQPGNACVGAGSVDGCFGAVGCCTPFCDVSVAPDPCTAPESCEAFYAPGTAPPGFENVGLCSLAP